MQLEIHFLTINTSRTKLHFFQIFHFLLRTLLCTVNLDKKGRLMHEIGFKVKYIFSRSVSYTSWINFSLYIGVI